MAIICEKREKILNFLEDKPKVYVIAPVKAQQVPFDKLLDEVSRSCGVGRAQVKASVEALLDRMELFMDYGMSVKLGDFGSFKPTISAKAQENAEDVDASTVRRKKIVFTPGKRFRDMLSDLSIATMSDNVAEAKLPEDGGGTGGDDDDEVIDPGF
ncbi:HU family DNA-binding protein [Bacteroides sp. 51]|uniref:HU family DNA-binding protein n=1 Tax=Bacteroides sp. 51 TaxID=2302938 RepID=UPI0013D1892A|nr:HU family DNA-binding protein [Bacteroides sp. 51]NDV83201.1 DNA-binding protein [Bacteroides sp. 51]